MVGVVLKFSCLFHIGFLSTLKNGKKCYPTVTKVLPGSPRHASGLLGPPGASQPGWQRVAVLGGELGVAATNLGARSAGLSTSLGFFVVICCYIYVYIYIYIIFFFFFWGGGGGARWRTQTSTTTNSTELLPQSSRQPCTRAQLQPPAARGCPTAPVVPILPLKP